MENVAEMLHLNQQLQELGIVVLNAEETSLTPVVCRYQKSPDLKIVHSQISIFS